MDIFPPQDEANLRRSPRRRSPEKSANVDTPMDDPLTGSKSTRHTSPERSNRSRPPIRKSLKKPTRDNSGLSMFETLFRDGEKSVLQSSNPPEAVPINGSKSGEGISSWDQSFLKSSLPDPPETSAGAAQPSALFGKSPAQKGGIGLFGQPSSPISHWPPHTDPIRQSASLVSRLFVEPPGQASPPLSGPFERPPFQPRTLFGQPDNASLARELFGIPLPRVQKKLILPSFVDPLDGEIGSWNPEFQVLPASPPPGILNMPYNADGEEELPDALDPRYDGDWNERLFDPVPGTGVYLGELKDLDERPRDQNVVYASLGLDGEVEVKARPFNRTGEKVPLMREGEVEFKDIQFRACFGGRSVSGGDMEDVKRCAKGRLDRKNELDGRRVLRFEEDVKRFWRNKKFGSS